MITTMTAIEYNAWMSLIKFISDNAPSVSALYGMGGTSIEALPAYPKDLADFRKPSIIVQKIHSKNRSIGMGGFLGQYMDDATNTLYDVKGRLYDMVYQLDINGDSNTSCSLLTDLIIDILNKAQDSEDPVEATLFNFLPDVNNPTSMGVMAIQHGDDITPLSSNDNLDYINALRLDIRIIQSIVGTGEMVDLSKPLKWTTKINHLTQTIKL